MKCKYCESRHCNCCPIAWNECIFCGKAICSACEGAMYSIGWNSIVCRECYEEIRHKTISELVE